ncbi:MAG: HipA domain-containing protein [Bacteroidetes bacterium]|nr:HipA domain-containing protein [Bacteroidota bacterium]
MRRCLFCYKVLDSGESDFHAACSRKMFGQSTPPELNYTEDQMDELARQVIQSQSAVTGVQPKISLHLATADNPNGPKKLTIVGLWGGYILKPATPYYPHLPEVEDLTMHLAELAQISTVPHSLIRLKSGNLAYITKRVDRSKKTKLLMEDMCQLTNRLTEHKYKGSYEQVAKAIAQYSDNPGIDIINFYEQVLFSFLTGNADMHLKNFSLLKQPSLGYGLCPAYDMVATALVNPADDEDMALTLNGRKKKIRRNDFIVAFSTLKLDAKQQKNIFDKMLRSLPAWEEMIQNSFLPEEIKVGYVKLLQRKFYDLGY